MNKKWLFRSLPILAFSVCAAGLSYILKPHEYGRVESAFTYRMVLDGSSKVESKDNGYLHQIDYKTSKIDMIGYSSQSGKFGSIKQVTYGSYTFPGVVYNRDVINGLNSLKVSYSGATLNCVFTDFLMEDMSLDSHPIASGTTIQVPSGKAYFMLYNNTTTPTVIDSIDVTYFCNKSADNQMIFNSSSTMGGARSLAKRTTFQNSYLELENNPTATTNNYSTGNHGGHADTWYRWNGRYFSKSKNLGTQFSFGMTVIGNISQVIDESKYFHYAVWPQFGFYDQNEQLHSTSNNYVQTYIGNDNYEPLGKDHALHPTDPYVNESYTGRFFTDYGWYNNAWQFANPDTQYIADGVTTFREAYEANTLPFWFLRFDVYLDQSNMPVCDVSINGFKLFTQDIFDDEGADAYDTVNTPGLIINSLPMHVVNYGVDENGTPAASYTGSFTYPRLIG